MKDNGNYVYDPKKAYHPISYEKLVRMLEFLDQTGFVSFSEA